MECSGHAQGCHTEASPGFGRTEEEFAREDTDEDLEAEAGIHMYVKIVLVVLPYL